MKSDVEKINQFIKAINESAILPKLKSREAKDAMGNIMHGFEHFIQAAYKLAEELQ